MMNSGSSQKWIEAGYELFATEGREGILIEKLARKIGRNKSGLYHHFGDLDIFIAELINYHYLVTDQFCKELSRLHHFDPDYLKLLIQYKNAAFVQMQLRRHIDDAFFKEAFHKVRRKTEKEILPLWVDFIKIQGNPSLALQLWDILRDLFFVRLNPHTLTLEFIHELVGDFSKIIETVRNTKAVLEKPPMASNLKPY
jgi:AcrR family transcriptional regulator